MTTRIEHLAHATSTLRTAIATALQLGIAAGVMLMIELQRRVAVQDDRARGGRG